MTRSSDSSTHDSDRPARRDLSRMQFVALSSTATVMSALAVGGSAPGMETPARKSETDTAIGKRLPDAEGSAVGVARMDVAKSHEGMGAQR